MATKQQTRVVVTLTKDRETKGTWLYREDNEGRNVRQIYLAKDKVKELGSPEEIKVTVEAA